jgi:D-arabinose 1-dehydrogenase-like Zn-dependent alcohol dehydrogenase
MATPTASEKIYAHSPEASQKVAGFRRQFSIFDVVLNRYTIRGSIAGTRMDLEEALTFAVEGKVKATIETQRQESINDVFARLKNGKVNGRIVLDIPEHASLGGFKKSVAAA